jgi:8-oxo-dGTP pyrophosphatase MutT (NUDIX family)
MNQSCTLDEVRQALDLTNFDASTAHLKMAPLGVNRQPPDDLAQVRIGAVLLLLYKHADELHLVLTRRRDDLPAHAGQISFPGGRQEKSETLLQTALRETTEEIGVPAAAVALLGQLTPIYIPPSGFIVHPFVGWYTTGQQPTFYPAACEVAEIIEAPLRCLLDPITAAEEPWEFHGQEVIVPYFALNSHKVWGATAIMLSEFVERLRQIRQ